MNQVQLPTAISLFYAIHLDNIEMDIIQCLSPDACLEDEGHFYQGHQEIKNWFTSAMQKYQFQAEPLKIIENQSQHISILTRVSGQFPNSPIQITYQFKLNQNLITHVIIS
ncbi:hypothetical protein G9F32_07820 [Acinetobacter sp. 194]|uniref:hypothetical protein n=1 Tax=Acinetobacter shaoyimingii TaxID=2715164 RepID=UPI0014079B92|nr:hypothetical protein [Acinetobacter shaoyimingii]NHB57935.1 hypothetical protein [Acinetobacter shaoyimingii]